MTMNFKKVLGLVVGLLIVVGLLTTLIPGIATNVTGLTTVSDELVGVGDAVETVFDFTLDRFPVEIGTFTATDETENFTDDGDGTLTGGGGGSGTITYTTGVTQLTFFVAPSALQDITATYDVDDVPVILRLIANYWWIGLTIVFIGLIMGTKAGRKIARKLSRGRKSKRRFARR